MQPKDHMSDLKGVSYFPKRISGEIHGMVPRKSEPPLLIDSLQKREHPKSINLGTSF